MKVEPPARAARIHVLAASHDYALATWSNVFVTIWRHAAFVRGVVTGLTLLARQPFPHQVCTLQAAGQLFDKESQRASLSFDHGAFETTVNALRAQVERAIPGQR